MTDHMSAVPMTRPGLCVEGCGGVAEREIVDRATRTPLGVLVCIHAAREWGISDTRQIRSSESRPAADVPPASAAAPAAGTPAVAGSPVSAFPPRGSGRRVPAGQSATYPEMRDIWHSLKHRLRSQPE